MPRSAKDEPDQPSVFEKKSWITLPPAAPPRWYLPAWPPAMTLAGLDFFKPMTKRGRVFRRAARLAAKWRLLRLLPASALPDWAASLSKVVPPGGHLALRPGWSGDRAAALIFDARARPVYIVKLALGRADPSFVREAESVRQLGPSLQEPLYAPQVLTVTESLLLYATEPIDKPLATPGVLPENVASGLGSFYRAGRTPTESAKGGLSHGDFAPWNVVPTSRGWLLFDWESAGRARHRSRTHGTTSSSAMPCWVGQHNKRSSMRSSCEDRWRRH